MKFSLVILLSLGLVLSASSWANSQLDSVYGERLVLTVRLCSPSLSEVEGSEVEGSRTMETKIQLETWVDRPELPFNEKLILTVKASWDGEQNRFKITPITPPECENFEILGSSSVNETKMVEGKTKSTKTFEFILKPTQTGTGRIGSVLFSYVDNVTGDSSSLSTQPINVKINPPIEKKAPNFKIILIVAIALIFIYVVYSAKRKTKRIKITDQTKEEVKIPEKTLEEETLETLSALSPLISEGKADEFSSKVYKLITNYLEEKYHIFTTGKTTNDIIDSLSPLNLSEEQIGLIKDTLFTCDLIKFAKKMVEKEKCEEIFNKVKKFLEQNSK
ncbi:MAG: BatD family protein [candidate division Zixibacteria bacterium]|nr:BatD family protein [candidate division Zixibacteria bacterium]